MPKKNKIQPVTNRENVPFNSENSIENIKFINSLKIQRSVLNKIIEAELLLSDTINSNDLESPDSKTSLKNSNHEKI